ncbi:MAG: hypothetical protein AABZ53_14355 [Planctomycetota bacterium]
MYTIALGCHHPRFARGDWASNVADIADATDIPHHALRKAFAGDGTRLLTIRP